MNVFNITELVSWDLAFLAVVSCSLYIGASYFENTGVRQIACRDNLLVLFYQSTDPIYRDYNWLNYLQFWHC